MKRGFLVFAFSVAAVFFGWDAAVTRGGLLRFVDAHPDMWKADTLLFSLASFHDLFNREDRALPIYERIVERYPDSPHGDSAQFSVAHCYERLKQRTRALEEYQKYLEKYPEGRFARSVSNNISLLRGT